MSKVSGTYPSLSRGVNQQPFEARLDGQHGEQINLWSDPVYGLSRRRGTVMQDVKEHNPNGPSYHELTGQQKKELREFYGSYRTVPYSTGGAELVIHFPTKPTPSWMRSAGVGATAGIKITRKIQEPQANQPGAIGVTVNIPRAVASTVRAAQHAGFSAGCQVGRYFCLYPNNTPFTVPAETDVWDSEGNRNAVVQIRQGVPNRTYKVSFVLDGVTHSVTYQTPSSAYSGILDTSDIPFSDPAYQKKVNDRVNAYNSAVTAWITKAALATRPEYIANQLAVAMDPILKGLDPTWGASNIGNTVYIAVGNANARRFSGLSADGGGGGASLTWAHLVVATFGDLPSAHYNGHIVAIQPETGNNTSGQGTIYVKAVVEDPKNQAGPCRWEECSRTSQGPINNPMLIVAVNPSTFVAGVSTGSTTGLTALGAAIGDSTVTNLPQFNGRLVGDWLSSPAPAFFGKPVTWMGMFQDRLCIAAGGVINMSEVGNYFNFWRTRTLTVPDKDPVGIYALGSESDTIVHSVIFDRNLLLFGELQQYSIAGRNPVTPSASTVIQSSSISGAVDCPPVTGGSLVFFGKRRETSTEIFQMEVGDVSDTSNFTGLGLQLLDYLPGKPAQILYVASPSMLFVRTTEAPHSVFVFRFIDSGRQRILDSWSRFDYHPAFGLIYGMFYHDDAVYFRVAREAWKDESGMVWRGGNGSYGQDVIERQSLLPQVAGVPYLDSIRKADSVYTGGGAGKDWWNQSYPFLATVFSRDRVSMYPASEEPPKFAKWLYGTTPNVVSAAEWAEVFADIPDRDMNYCVTGIMFKSEVELTSPVRRGQDGQPMMQGRLTVSRLDVYYRDSSGFVATIKSMNSEDAVLNFNGRVLGPPSNMVGIIPVTSGSTSVFIGRESKDYVCKIGSRSWMPLSITRITWTGQWFMNHRFV